MEQYDLVVIGGGPAGSVLATLVAQAGHSVLLIDREKSPRHQVGESLLPSIRDIAGMVGIGEQLDRYGFVTKRGATLSWGIKHEPYWTMNFGRVPADMDELPGDAPFAYNVPRAELDAIFLSNARDHGVNVLEATSFKEAMIEDGRVCGIVFADNHNKATRVRAQFVVAATGFRHNALCKLVGKREYSRFYRNVGLYGYYDNGGRLPAPLAGNILMAAFDEGWIWYIPLSEMRTSVGAVVPARYLGGNPGDHRAALDKWVARCPQVSALLRSASPCTVPPYDKVRFRSDFSYCTTTFWLPGAAVVGDAACFVDVFLSSGVHLATYGALLLARSVNSALSDTAREQTYFDEYEVRYRLEYIRFYNSLIGLYDMARSEGEYLPWLRNLLQTTHGVFVEHPGRPIPSKQVPNHQGVQLLRNVLSKMMREEIAPSMDHSVRPIEFDTECSPSDDKLKWVLKHATADQSARDFFQMVERIQRKGSVQE